jgi:hypothetical protein
MRLRSAVPRTETTKADIRTRTGNLRGRTRPAALRRSAAERLGLFAEALTVAAHDLLAVHAA